MLSRKDDPAVKEREHALQSLDLAYHKYKEIVRHLDEGLKVSDSILHVPAALTFLSQFYNDLAGILMQFKDSCKEWRNMRRAEIR